MEEGGSPRVWQFDATAYLAPYRSPRLRESISLALTEHTYSPKEEPATSWMPSILRALHQVERRIQVRDLLILGTGNGLDALGAISILGPRSVSITDLSEDILAIARRNIVENLAQPGSVELHSYAGDLLSCVPSGPPYCLIFENLPNLPLPSGVELAAGINSASFFDPARRDVPRHVQDHLLGLHYLFLRQAHSRVRPGGGVLTCIGGRIPTEVVLELHRACGYEPELVAFDVKLQSEPETVLPRYCEAQQRSGVRFRYYAPHAVEAVARARAEGLEGAGLASAVQGLLANAEMSAEEAWQRSQRGEQVAHSVLLTFARKREAPGGA